MDSLPPPYTVPSPIASNPYELPSPSVLKSAIPTNNETYITPLPAFNTPRKYSSRLRRLLQQRSNSRGVYLTLHIPSNLTNCKLISIDSASTTSPSDSDSSSRRSSSEESTDSISQTNLQITEKTPLLALSAGIPFVEDLEAGTFTSCTLNGRSNKPATRHAKTKPSSTRRSSRRGEHAFNPLAALRRKELKSTTKSWLTVLGLLLLVFTVICGAAVFIAWATGFTSGRLAEMRDGLQRVGITYGNVVVADAGADAGFVQHDQSVQAKEDGVDGQIRRSRVARGLNLKSERMAGELVI